VKVGARLHGSQEDGWHARAEREATGEQQRREQHEPHELNRRVDRQPNENRSRTRGGQQEFGTLRPPLLNDT